MSTERILITRTEPGASKTANLATQRGYSPVVSPLARVEMLHADVSLDAIDAVALTSPNGARAFARLTPERSLPVLAVGGATAEAAREAGFTEITDADSDAAGLAQLISDRMMPGTRILHARGEIVARDLSGLLAGHGILVLPLIVYRTHAVSSFTEPARAALQQGPVIATVHSPGGANRLVAALEALGGIPAGLFAAAISPAAAEPLRAAGIAPVEIADAPTDAGLLDAADRLGGEPEGQ